jgi:hypothetical protein
MIRIVPYSDLSIVLIGETFSIKDKIKALGGTFNKSLSIENNKIPGWVFPKTKESDIEELVKSVNNNKSSNSTSTNKTVQQNDIKGPISIDPKITHEMFANLLNKYEMLEARVNYLEKQSLKSGKPTISSTSSSTKFTKKTKVESSSDYTDSETETNIQSDRFLED